MNHFNNMNRNIISNFNKKENAIKVSLLNEIKNKFNTYKREKVIFYPIFKDEEIEGLEGFDELEDIIHDVCPLVMNDYCQIDATALPHSITYEDDKLILRVDGECSNPNTDCITLEEPTYSLTVDGLYNLLLLIKHPSIKKLNKTILK